MNKKFKKKLTYGQRDVIDDISQALFWCFVVLVTWQHGRVVVVVEVSGGGGPSDAATWQGGGSG